MKAPFYVEAHDYAGLRLALRQRVEQLNVSRNCLDNVTGLPSGCRENSFALRTEENRRNVSRAARSSRGPQDGAN